MEYKKLLDSIETSLKKELPGINAHRKMMPAGREARVREELEKKKVRFRVGGVMILLFPLGSKISFPLTLRHDYKGAHANQVSLPGGKIEDDDVDIIHTALRETEEEIGVPQAEVKILGRLTDLYIPPSQFKITPVVGALTEMPEFRIDPREVRELILADLEHIIDSNFRKNTRLEIQNRYQLDAPYYDVHGHIVWGATSMILSEFSHIIDDIYRKG